jgi:hypothetical protein
MSRKPISKSKRFEVFKRDNFTCQYCGSTPPKAVLHVDHINPVKLGGGNEPDNLITACDHCNLGKAARPLSSIPKSLADKAAEVAEREAQIAGYAAVIEAARDRVEDDMWRVAEELQPGASDGYSRDRLGGIKHFVTKLAVHEVLEAAEIANAKHYRGTAKAFKYFCGICWRKIRETEE